MVFTNRLLRDIVLSTFLKPTPKDSKESKSAKLGHHMEKALIKNLLSDSKNENVATVSPIEAVWDTGVVMMKHNQENITTTDFLVGNTNEMHLHEINSIECKTRRANRKEETKIDQWGDSKYIKINCNDPNFSDTVIEKSESTQYLYHASALCLSTTLLLIGIGRELCWKEFRQFVVKMQKWLIWAHQKHTITFCEMDMWTLASIKIFGKHGKKNQRVRQKKNHYWK